MKLLLPGDISTFADSVVVTLRNSQIWVDALVGAKLDPDPAPVQRLDDDDDIYYIVTLTKSQGITARIAIAGNVRRLLEVEGIQNPGEFLEQYVDPLDVLKEAAKKHPPPAEAVFRPEMVGRHPVLVWRPCRESQSRFLPFWLVTVRDRLLYIRVDGAVFGKLTTIGHG